MKKRWWVGMILAAGMVTGGSARAADHRDGPKVLMDPASDINDVYAWMSADASKVYLAMTVFPAADAMSKFSNTVKYVFHTASAAGYGMAQTDTDVICTFDVAQKISCWVGTADYVSGDASATAGLSSTSGKVKVFAGLREDPFFFNLDGFNKVQQTVASVASMLTFNMAGCPTLDAATATSLVNQLKQNPMGMAATDFFGSLNTLAIVLAVDKTLLTSGGPIMSVWGSTNR